MENKAAVIIYTRMKNIGFPKGFMIQPEDFTKEDGALFLKYVHSAMDNVVELRSTHKHAKVMIRNGKYVILGIVTYLRDILKDEWDTSDKGNRPVYGFFGYVWHKEDYVPHRCFPGHSNFADMLETWIRPHWMDSENSKWADTQHYSKYESVVEFSEDKADVRFFQDVPEKFAGTTVLIPSDKEESSVLWGMQEIGKNRPFSLCTNVCVYSIRDFSSEFQYIVQLKGVEAITEKTDHEPPPKVRAKTSADPGPDRHLRTESGHDFERSPKTGHIFMVSAGGAILLISLLLWIVFHSALPRTVFYGLVVLSCVILLVIGILLFKRTRSGNANPKKDTISNRTYPDQISGLKLNTDNHFTGRKSFARPDQMSAGPDRKNEALHDEKNDKKETAKDVFTL